MVLFSSIKEKRTTFTLIVRVFERIAIKEKIGDENPYAVGEGESDGVGADTAAASEEPVPEEREALAPSAGTDAPVKGAIPADSDGEVITFSGDTGTFSPLSEAAALYTGEDATVQRLTAEGGELFKDLQAIANVMTNVVVGAHVELTFKPGETEKYLEIVPKDNTRGDGDRMFCVILGAPKGETTNSAASACAVTILDDEEQEPAEGTHVSSFSGAGKSYWKSIFKATDPFNSFAEGIKESANAISMVRDAAKDAKANNEKIGDAGLGGHSWRFDIAVGVYFDFINVTVTIGETSETKLIFNGIGGYVSVTLGFQMAWYIVLPIVFLPAYFGDVTHVSVMSPSLHTPGGESQAFTPTIPSVLLSSERLRSPAHPLSAASGIPKV